jgi:hypothetical protein
VRYDQGDRVTGVLVLAQLRRLFLVVGLVFAALPGGSALADTTVGQTGTPREGLATGDEVVQTDATVPTAGMVTSFQTQSGSSQPPFPTCEPGGTFNFQMLRPVGNDQYRVLGDTGDQTDPCDGQFHSVDVNSISVQPGDVLGVYVVRSWAGIISDTSGSVVLDQNASEPAVGQTISVTSRFTGTLDEGAILTTGVGGPPPPTSKARCKHDGWKNFPQFKNQGACVSFVATHGKNPPSGS